MKKTGSVGITVILLLSLFTILEGSSTANLHPTCIDEQYQNDGDSDFDFGQFAQPPNVGYERVDLECVVYPFSDGNGEFFTPVQDRYNGYDNYPELFDVLLEQGGGGIISWICFNPNPYIEPNAPAHQQQAEADFNAFVAENCN